MSSTQLTVVAVKDGKERVLVNGGAAAAAACAAAAAAGVLCDDAVATHVADGPWSLVLYQQHILQGSQFATM